MPITQSFIFSAFQVAPAGIQYEENFLSLIGSVETQSQHPIAQCILEIVKKNNFPIYPVIAFQEFPHQGVGAAVEIKTGVYRAVLIGKYEFLQELGFNIPETLIVASRRWANEKTQVVYAGWDGWIRGVLKIEHQ